MANIFNNIKVLTDLEVRNTATMKEGLIISGALSGTTGIHVLEDAKVDGELIVGGRVTNQGYAQIGALVVEGLTSLSGNLVVTGSEYLSGQLIVTGSISTLGNLSSSNGEIDILKARVISGSIITGLNGGAITSNAAITASNGVEAVTNGFNAANGTGYKLQGTETLKAASGLVMLQSSSLNKIQLGNLGYGGVLAGAEGIKANSKDATVVISPRTILKLSEAGASQLDIDNSATKIYSTAGDVLLSGSAGIYAESNLIAEKQLKLSGSANFKNISAVSRDENGLYDVDAAIHALDNLVNLSDSNYAKMRFASSGSISDGHITLDLVSSGADSVFYAPSQLNYLVADVMVRTSNTSPWSNDLLSVYLYEDAGSIKIDIDVPAASAGWEYRLIIVNENGEIFI